MDKIFKVSSSSQSGLHSSWTGAAVEKNFKEIDLCIPPEFEGPGLGYSPEDLYALALLNCYIATFKFVAEKSRLEFREISGSGQLIVDKGERNALWMRQFQINIELKGAKQPERAIALMEKTSKNCMIINSVQTEVTFSFQVKD
jgi:organic hydroperoxide reductase OsmC/OhrA